MSAMFEWMIPPDLPIAKQLGSVGSVLHMGTCSKNIKKWDTPNHLLPEPGKFQGLLIPPHFSQNFHSTSRI